MEQCPFCREPDRFVRLLDDMQTSILELQGKLKRIQSEVTGMSRVENHMHYLTMELAEFKTDRKTLLTAVNVIVKHQKAISNYVKKTGIIP